MTSNHLLLYRLAELMLEQEKHILPVDVLFDDEQIGDFVKSIQIDSPYQQMLLEGVLTESVSDEKLNVCFTVEGYFHFVLGEVFETHFLEKTTHEILEEILPNKLIGLQEGLEYYLIRNVDKQRFSVLIWFIDFGNEFTNSTIKPLSHAFLVASNYSKNHIKELSKALFSTPTDNDIRLIKEVLDRLEKAQKSDVLRMIFDEVLTFIEPSTIKKANLFVNTIQFLPSDEKVKKLDELLMLNFDNFDIEVVKYYQDIGSVWNTLGNYDKSIVAYKHALYIIDQIEDYHPELKSEIYNNLGVALQNNGKIEDSIECYSQSLEGYLNHFGGGYLAIGTIYSNLGLIYQQKGDNSQALTNYKKALDLDHKLFGNHHPNTATTYTNIGSLYVETVNFELAKTYYHKAIKIFKSVFGEFHQWTATIYNNFSLVYLKEKEFELAIDNAKKALSIIDRVFGTAHPWYATTLNNIGGVYQESGDYENSMLYFMNGLKLKRAAYGEEHPSVGISYFNIAKCYSDLNDLESARLNFKRALTIFQNTFGEGHPHTILVTGKLKKLNDL